MPQIINETPSIGSLFGQGLGSALNDLAQQKLEQFSSRNRQATTARGLSALGIPQEDALSIAALPDQLQGLVVKNYLASGEREGFDQALAALRGEPAQQQQPMEKFYQQAAPQKAGLAAVQDLIASKGVQNPFAQQLNAQQVPVQQVQQQQQSKPQQLQAKSLSEILKSPRLSPEQRLKLEAMAQSKELQKQKLSAREQEVVNKETKPFYDEITKGSKAAHNSDKRLDRMEKLIDSGKLNSATFISALESAGGVSAAIGGLLGAIAGAGSGLFGGPAGSIAGGIAGGTAGAGAGKVAGQGLAGVAKSLLLTPESQEFNKLSFDFLKDAKDTFGNRLTNYDVETFLSTVPSLSQTDEGKRRVITNLRSFNKAAVLRKHAMDQVIKENGGRRPANLDVLVEERIAPQLDDLAEKFKEGIA